MSIIQNLKYLAFNHLFYSFSIPPNLRSPVYLAGIKYGNKADWDFMFKMFKKTPFPSEERKLMFSLADTQDKTILKK